MGYEIIITFILYLIFLLGIGIYFYKKSSNAEDYLLGGRGVGAWVTALSAQASDMSGWLLMGLPGAIYLFGMNQVWIAVGLIAGTYLNWKFVAPRLRAYTEKLDSLTLPTFFEKRFRDETGIIRNTTAFIILFFFTIYVSSGFVSSGKLFSSMFKMDYKTAVVIGAVIVVLYTFLGGYLAVCWTDFFQGLLMLFAIVIVPVMAYKNSGGVDNIINTMNEKNLSLNLFIKEGKTISVISIISAVAWGLGYFGQPHILVRFMGIKSVKEIKKSRLIAIIWVIISLLGAVMVGLIGIGLYNDIADLSGDAEKIFIYMIIDLFNPWLGGILLAAILSAIMSTIDSQLLVASSVLTEDFYLHVIKRKAGEKEMVWVSRICVLIIALIAIILALDEQSKILDLVAYAWGGFGAAFGPLILVSLFSKKIGWRSAFVGMVVGTLTLIIWKSLGYDSKLYEIVPGFFINLFCILVLNRVFKENLPDINNEFDEIKKEVRN